MATNYITTAASSATPSYTTYYPNNPYSTTVSSGGFVTGNSTIAAPYSYYTEWQPPLEPLPVFADAKTARANLQQQLDLLESLQDGLIGDHALYLDDTVFFLRETIEHLDKIIGN